MLLSDIREFPTVIEVSKGKYHESCMRSFHIVAKVLELLDAKTPPGVLVEMINDLKDARSPTMDLSDRLSSPFHP